MAGYYDEISAEFEAKKLLLNSNTNVPYCINTLPNGTSVFQMDFKYNRFANK